MKILGCLMNCAKRQSRLGPDQFFANFIRLSFTVGTVHRYNTHNQTDLLSYCIVFIMV